MGVYEDEEYIDEFGNKRTRKVAKIKKDAMKRMKEKEQEDEERYSAQKPKRKVLREVEEIDEFGNVRKVLVDDEGNVVDEDDVVYEDEEYIDEYGQKRTRKVAKIKKDAMKRMQEKEKEDEERYEPASKPKRTVIKEVEEIDEFGNVRKVLREVEEEGIKKAPKTRDLQEKIIIDKDGNKIKVLIDDQGNVVDAKDVVYEDEEYIDEFGNVKTRKVAKIKKDAMKRMQ